MKAPLIHIARTKGKVFLPGWGFFFFTCWHACRCIKKNETKEKNQNVRSMQGWNRSKKEHFRMSHEETTKTRIKIIKKNPKGVIEKGVTDTK